MMKNYQYFCLLTLGIAAACSTVQVSGDPAVQIAATAQTAPVGTANEDAADDPAIWRNDSDPSASLIVATDKKAGLYVYGLDGEVRSFLPGGLLNNVDLIELADGSILIGASDRGDPMQAKVLLARLDVEAGRLTELARVDAGPGEAYGFCFGEARSDGSVTMYSPIKDGRIALNIAKPAGGSWSNETYTLAQLSSQPEGCVFDPRQGQLYVGEEVAGIWRLDGQSGEREMVAEIDNRMLVADVEGLALAPSGTDGGYLVASSQGDNAYAVFKLPNMTPLGRFRIGGNVVGSAEETDGIALDPRSFGPNYPQGLFVAQDGDNRPDAQNFKLVSWHAVMDALEESPR
ncbi:MAG: phytase [Pseudomonadota bacterium]